MADALKFLIELEDKFSSPANKVLSSVGRLGESLGEIGETLGPLIKVEAAMVALGATAVVGGAALALHASELKQDTLDMLEAMQGSQEAAVATYSAIENMGDTVALSQTRGLELARELSAAGLTNKEALIDSIKTIGQVESVLGKEAGGKVQRILEKATQTGQFKLEGKSLLGTGIQQSAIVAQLSKQLGVVPATIEKELAAGKIKASDGITAINAVLQSKFAGPASKQVLDIGNQFQRLKDNFMKLFEDVDTGPFLDAFHGIVKVFDQSTASGKTFKFLITSFFDGLFKVVAKVGPYVTTFLKGMAIIGLKIYIALKPLLKTIADTFGGGNGDSVATFAGLLSKVGDAAAFVVQMATPMLQLFVKATSIFIDVESYLVSLIGSFYDAGSNIISGLISGVTDGASKAVAAVQDVGQSMLDKFTGLFGIHSDSKVMDKFGGHLMGGLKTGIAANDTGAGQAMADAVTPVASRGASASSPTSVSFGPGSIVITVNGSNASEVAAQLKQVLPGELGALFESMSITVGAA